MPLVGCLAIIGVFMAAFVLLFLFGYARVKSYTRAANALHPSSAGQVGSSLPGAGGSPPASDAAPSRLPFAVPDGFVVRPVRRELPCGATVEAYLLIPTYSNPCGQ